MKPLQSEPVIVEQRVPVGPLSGKAFQLTSEFKPAGDQPQAIADIVAGIRAGERDARRLSRWRGWPVLPKNGS